MRMKHWTFAVGVLVGLGLSSGIAHLGDRAIGLPQEGVNPAADPVKRLLAKVRTLEEPVRGHLVPSLPAEIIAEARTLCPRLGAALSSDISFDDKRLILDLVKQCGPEARSILKEVCRSREYGLPEDLVTDAIKSLCSDRDVMVKELERLARDGSKEQRGCFPWMLAMVGVPARQLIPIEHSLMTDSDPDVRVAAADALVWEMRGFNKLVHDLVPTMMRAALTDSDDRVRSSAVEGLVLSGLVSGEAFDILIQNLKSHEVDEEKLTELLLITASYAEPVASRVDKMLQSEDPLLRRWGIRLAMRGLRYTRVGILPKLRKAAQDSDPEVKREARGALDELEGKN